MAFAFNYFNTANLTAEAESNFASLTYENVVASEDTWKDEGEIWLLGRRYQLPEDKMEFLHQVRSLLWFTYRKGYSPIGGTGPTSDTGWGCMLRCGQMMLAQALSVLTFDKDYKWTEEGNQPRSYRKLLQQLGDERSRCYSIHQIAQMGVEEGKEVGQWFGPNTISQVLRRLSQFDQENVLTIHVAMDNTVCVNDIERLCSPPTTEPTPCAGACSSICPSCNPTPGESPSAIPPSEDFW
uniref:Cysteine protease n=1 Tax=Ciona savignyi TaxID=51511 RepID=H2ZEI6_CIOSA